MLLNVIFGMDLGQDQMLTLAFGFKRKEKKKKKTEKQHPLWRQSKQMHKK